MKVLITCDLFPPTVRGGTEIITYSVAKTLKENGHEVEIFCHGDSNMTIYKGIKTTRRRFKKWYLANILAVPIIFRLAKYVDVIHNFTFDTSIASWLVAKALGKPLIMSIMGVYGGAWVEMKRSYLKGKIREFFEWLQLKLPCQKVLFLSEYSRNLAIKLGVPRHRSEVLTPEVDGRKFKPGKKEPLVLFVGRLTPQKGVKYLIWAARRLPNVKFIIVGRGVEMERLKKAASKNVKFLGFIPHEDKWLHNLFSRALIFCLPSIGEGLGLVLLEAMASGCAIVSTIPFDYSGFTVRPRDAKGLATKIKYLMENKKVALRMGMENRKRARRYRWTDILKIYASLGE